MKYVIIICEGETEKEFCQKILAPYFNRKDIDIRPPLIKKSMGGIVKWPELQKQIALHLKSEPKAYVTTLIDYYGLYKKYGFPKWYEAELLADKNQRMDMLELGMKEDIEDSIRHRFIPYMQLHEFEGLLFNEINIFYEQIPSKELVGIEELKQIFVQYDNPEMINNNRDTSPSHRLKRIISGYNKVVYGNIIAEAIGLEKIRVKCPRFDRWLTYIEEI